LDKFDTYNRVSVVFGLVQIFVLDYRWLLVTDIYMNYSDVILLYLSKDVVIQKDRFLSRNSNV